MRQRYIILVASAVLTVIPLAGVLASDTLPSPTPTPTAVPSSDSAAHLNNLQANGASEVDRRLNNLQAAQQKLQDSSTISAADKKTLISQIQAEQAALGTMKNQLSADTSLGAARSDIQNIVNEYAIYGILLPKLSLASAADRFVTTGAQFGDLVAKLQSQIDSAKVADKDTKAADASMTDMKAKLADAKTKYDGLVGKLNSQKAVGYAATHKLLANDRDALAAARSDFTAARQDAAGIITVFTAKGVATPTPTPVGTPIP